MDSNACGPLLWAPMSEAYGRKPSVLIPIFGLMLFSFASATAENIQTLLITRFFGGVFGGAPLSNVGGVLADIWPATQRGPALLMWGLSVIVGPLLAPIVGGALVVSEDNTGWRWTEYVSLRAFAEVENESGAERTKVDRNKMKGYRDHSLRLPRPQHLLHLRKLRPRPVGAQSESPPFRNQELGHPCQISGSRSVVPRHLQQVPHRALRDAG